MNDSDTEFIADDLLILTQANIHVVKSSTAESNMEESNVVFEKESKQKVRGREKKKQPKRRVLTSIGKKGPIQS